VSAVNAVENKVSMVISEIEESEPQEPGSMVPSDGLPVGSVCSVSIEADNASSASAGSASWMAILGDISRNLRLPDYISVEVAGGDFGVVGGAVATVTRYGDVYVGPVLGGGIPGIAGIVSAGWIDQFSVPGRDQLSNFVHGNSITLSGYVPWPWGVAGPAAAEVYGNVGSWGLSAFGTQVGIGGGVGKYAGLEWSYSFNVDHHGPTW
jgi:hypothetical protein